MNTVIDHDTWSLRTTTAVLDSRTQEPEDRLLSILEASKFILPTENAWVGGPVTRNTPVPCWNDLIALGAQVFWVETEKPQNEIVKCADIEIPGCQMTRRRYRPVRARSMSFTAAATWLCAVSMDVADDREEEFNDWYSEEHVPRIATVPGVVSAGRFIAIEGYPRYLALYYTEGPAILMSPEYADATETPWTRRVRRFMRSVSRYVYRHSSLMRRGPGSS
ncbi:MAG: hypothetical protein A3H27_02585 [Acidobacteria bacterium RIFCSPLOWO2_02_FULL_59_13]|nr:MAG: hypothetical protein A3H27_02585 [Acidobacteria bacterium RIFCSPLOWO2_02_FULL_59_13]OGA67676.1 MAG: hypothetical protein A3G81_11075 [Betaproteobacteria bacterium RIFCSPLOWO2_12_FULL_65_14]